MYIIPGIDISHYEPNIDWAVLKSSNTVRFAFIKAGQGTISDDYFKRHWSSAKSINLPAGAYHLYDPVVSPKRQAESFFDILDDDLGTLPVVLDLELYTETRGQYHGWRCWYDWLERFKQLAPGKAIIIYTAYFYWRDQGIPWWRLDLSASLKYFAQYPLWIAYYTDLPQISTPEIRKIIPKPWTSCLFWQWSESGRLAAVRNDGVDLDFFNGSEEEFAALTGIPIPIPIPTPEDPEEIARLAKLEEIAGIDAYLALRKTSLS
jgi:lysozyme